MDSAHWVHQLMPRINKPYLFIHEMNFNSPTIVNFIHFSLESIDVLTNWG